MAQPAARHGRFWLYAPLTLLVLAAVAWSVAWFVIRNRTSRRPRAMDSRRKPRRGAAGPATGAQVAGYPFRIEIICPALVLQKNALIASLGRVEAVAQVYQPRHVITEIDGPLRLTDGTVDSVEGTWQLFDDERARRDGARPQRISIVAEAPSVTHRRRRPDPTSCCRAVTSKRMSARTRRGRRKRAFDVAIAADEAKIPPLDALVGGEETADLRIDATATQVLGFRGCSVVEESRALARGGRQARHTPPVARQVSAPDRSERNPSARSAAPPRRPSRDRGCGARGPDRRGCRQPCRRKPPRRASRPGAAPVERPERGAAARPHAAPRLEDGRLLLGPFTVPRPRLPPLH